MSIYHQGKLDGQDVIGIVTLLGLLLGVAGAIYGLAWASRAIVTLVLV